MDYTFHYSSPIGNLTLTSNGTHLTGLRFNTQKYVVGTLGSNSRGKMLPIFKQTVRWLDIYFSGRCPDFTPPLKVQTTPFRKQVWEMILKIPYGQSMTYGKIAANIARKEGLKKMSAQAIGGAVGHNAIAIIIPCHRVIGANGHLMGYAWGIEKKVKLLQLEKYIVQE